MPANGPAGASAVAWTLLVPGPSSDALWRHDLANLGLALDAEDSLSLDRPVPLARPPHGSQNLRVAVIRLLRTVTTAHEIHHRQVMANRGPRRRAAPRRLPLRGSLGDDLARRAKERETPARAPAARDVVPVDVAVRLDAFGDLVADHLDAAPLRRLIAEGPIPALPFVLPGVPA